MMKRFSTALTALLACTALGGAAQAQALKAGAGAGDRRIQLDPPVPPPADGTCWV